MKIKNLVLSAIFAAIIFLLTFLSIPLSFGYIHLGDTAIYIAATVLPTPWAIASAVVGAGLADLALAPLYIPATIIIKALLTLFIKKRNILSFVLCALVTVLGYALAELILYRSLATAAMGILPNTVQAVFSLVIYSIVKKYLPKKS